MVELWNLDDDRARTRGRIAAHDLDRNVLVAAARVMAFRDGGGERRTGSGIQRPFEPAVTMPLRPTLDVQIARDRHHGNRFRHALGEQHRERSSAAISEENDLFVVPFGEERAQCARHAAHDFLRIAPMGPGERRTRFVRFKAEITRPAEIQHGGWVERQQLQSEGIAWRGIGGDARPFEPWRAVMLDINVEFCGLRDSGAEIDEMLIRRTGDDMPRELQFRGALLDALCGRTAADQSGRGGKRRDSPP